MTISTKNMVRAALFAGAMALCAWLAVPISDIGFTMQTFGVFLALGLLGGKWGTVSIGLYLLLGLVGLPVFSGFRGGPGMLLGVTGGYLWGFLLSGFVYWALERFGKLPAMIGGLIVCYACGTVWFLQYSGGGWALVLLRCVAPYVIPDGIKIAMAWTLSKRLARHLS